MIRTKRLLFVGLVLLVAGAGQGCSPHSRPINAATPTETSKYCQMAGVALKATVRPFDEQPYGLERACVVQAATLNGNIYVDARFTDHASLETVPEQTCRNGAFVIRFDWKQFVASPSPAVVLLTFDRGASEDRSFNAVIEAPDWPSKRPATMSLSECGSAFGRVRWDANGWRAEVTRPPRLPDAIH